MRFLACCSPQPLSQHETAGVKLAGRLACIPPNIGCGEGWYFKPTGKYNTVSERWYPLRFPAKVMLIVTSTLKPGFAMPGAEIAKWYGISANSGAGGGVEVAKRGMLDVQRLRRDDILAPEVYVVENRYTLIATVKELPTARASWAQET